MVCHYHEGGGLDATIVLIVARVESIGPVLPILEEGRCVCHFVFGLHRLWWQHRVFLLRLGGQNLHPTSHPTPLPHVSNWPTVLRPSDLTAQQSHRHYAIHLHFLLHTAQLSPFDRAVKSAYKQYIHWMKKEFVANSIRNGLDYFHRQCNNRHIRMDVELELLCSALDVLAWSHETG
jgi:hypothetical protein